MTAALVVLLDDAGRAQLIDALRLFEGRLVPSGQRLSPPLAQLRDLLRTTAANGDVAVVPGYVVPDDDDVTTTSPPRLLTYNEAGAVLGVSPRHVARLVAERRLPAVDLGPQTKRIHPDDLAAVVDQRRSPSGDAA